VFDLLRGQRPFAFFAEPVIPFIEPGAGYYPSSTSSTAR
jgi:hypothetical protein